MSAPVPAAPGRVRLRERLRDRLAEPAAVAVEDRMFRALGVLRLVLMANVVALNWVRRDNADHRWALWLVVGVIVAWTLFTLWSYAAARRRTLWLLLADLAVAVSLLLLSAPIKGEGMRATIPGFWVMGALLAWSVHGRTRGGLIAAGVLIVADVSVRQELTQSNYGNLFLLAIGAPVVGYLVASLQQMAVERDRAERAAAVAAERTRLARAVHDGVLQVLSLVQRRAGELGDDGARLAALAGEQERSLRLLIQQEATDGAGADETLDQRPGDVAAALAALTRREHPRVLLADPGGPVPLPAPAVEQLAAAVAACLDNVAQHVGDDASAHVLLEDLGDEVAVTVRDDGPGIARGRLEQARDEGRLGIGESVEGRLRDLGGRAELDTGPWGTTWFLTVPRPAEETR